MTKKVFREMLISLFAAVLFLMLLPLSVFAEGEPQSDTEKGPARAKRTILLYDCGSDLETEAGLASYNLRQILRASFSADEDVRFIVMTGGADKWHMEENELVFPDDVEVPDDAISLSDRTNPHNPDDPETYSADLKKTQISNTYNQIWEAKGADAKLENGEDDPNAGKLVLLDGDGIMGDGENARRSIIDIGGYTWDGDRWSIRDDLQSDHYEWMNNPEVLKAFINYGVDHYPAEKYDLILWDHGSGTDGGFCSDMHETSHGMNLMELNGIVDALSHNKVVDTDEDGNPDSRFDLVDFDACLMSSVEINLTLSDLTDYYIASPETEPGYGQDYEGWLNLAGENPEIDTYELGKKIVDDFIAFYDKPSGDGSSQEGTLALIDMNKLMTRTVQTEAGERGFLEALDELTVHMQNEIVWENLYYDEFRSFRDSISYGEQEYYDLGNLVSQLSYAFQEADYEDLNQDGSINDRNAYSDTAKVLLTILNDPTVIYARGTRGIHTEEQFFRGTDGELQKGTQGTSGMYLTFKPLDIPDDIFSHHMFMKIFFRSMDPDDPRIKLIKNLNTTMIRYGLVYHTGTAVTDMVSSGTPKETIDYAAVKDYWLTHTDKWGAGLWESNVASYMEALDEGEEKTKDWLEPIIRQQRDEAILKDQIQTKTIETEAGTGCEITLNEIRKQAINNITMNVIAELPSVEAFLNDPEHQNYVVEQVGEMSKDFSIGKIIGKQVFDVDPATQGYEKAIDWLFERTSKWELDPPGDQWYALEDAEGRIHALAPDVSGDEVDVPTGYYTTEMQYTYDYDKEDYVLAPEEKCHVVYLVYMKDANGDYNLNELYFMQENGGWRGIPASEYDGSLELCPLVEIVDNWDSCYLPVSQTTFTLSKETIPHLNLKYMNISEIPDIADTDGDGRNMHTTVTVNNIYGQQMDITDLVNEAGSSDDPSDKTTETTEVTKKTKKKNTLTLKGRTVKIKYKKLKKKAQKRKVTKLIRFVKKGQGKKTYQLVSAKKGKKSFKKFFKINKKTGKLTIKKNKKMKKGTYKVKIKVKAAGNANYKAGIKTVTVKLLIK